MRWVPIALVALLVAIQYPLWLGKGGWMRVRDSEHQLAAQNKANADLTERNAKLAAEVKDLREGAGAVEERARYELGMVKEGEAFVQIVDPSSAAPGPPVPTSTEMPLVDPRRRALQPPAPAPDAAKPSSTPDGGTKPKRRTPDKPR